MRAYHGGSGTYINLDYEDKLFLEKNGKVECELSDFKNPIVTFHLCDVVESGFLEEPGVHLDVFPPDASPEFRERYDIYIDKNKFKELTVDSVKTPIEGGYIVCRGRYDRLDIVYWPL